jgi:MFS family permease
MALTAVMTGFWYTKSETPNRQTLWYSALGLGVSSTIDLSRYGTDTLQGIIGGFMATGISKRAESESVPKWTVIFWILGAITMAWAFVLYFVLADSPAKAFWLKEDQKYIAVQRVSAGMVGIKSKKFKIDQVKAALLDPKTYLLFIATFATSIPTGVLSNFSTVMYETSQCPRRRRCADSVASVILDSMPSILP